MIDSHHGSKSSIQKRHERGEWENELHSYWNIVNWVCVMAHVPINAHPRPFTTKMVLINHTASHGNKIHSRYRSHYYIVSVLQLIEVNYISEVWWSHPKQTLWKYAKTLHDATYGLDETWAWTILSNRWLLMISLSVILQGCLDSAIPESLLNHSPRCFRCPKWLVHATTGVSK